MPCRVTTLADALFGSRLVEHVPSFFANLKGPFRYRISTETGRNASSEAGCSACRARVPRWRQCSTRGILPSSAVELGWIKSGRGEDFKMGMARIAYFTCGSVKACVIRRLNPRDFGAKELPASSIPQWPAWRNWQTR